MMQERSLRWACVCKHTQLFVHTHKYSTMLTQGFQCDLPITAVAACGWATCLSSPRETGVQKASGNWLTKPPPEWWQRWERRGRLDLDLTADAQLLNQLHNKQFSRLVGCTRAAVRTEGLGKSITSEAGVGGGGGGTDMYIRVCQNLNVNLFVCVCVRTASERSHMKAAHFHSRKWPGNFISVFSASHFTVSLAQGSFPDVGRRIPNFHSH